jgi:hypothetical protein
MKANKARLKCQTEVVSGGGLKINFKKNTNFAKLMAYQTDKPISLFFDTNGVFPCPMKFYPLFPLP